MKAIIPAAGLGTRMKSRLPKWYPLVRAYLASPVRPLAAQMYLVATPTLPIPNDDGGAHLER